MRYMKKLCASILCIACMSTLVAQGYFQHEQPVGPARTPDRSERSTTTVSLESDQEISRQIRGKLNEWNYGQVTFDVNNGYVSMRGAVETQDDKNKIDRAVRNIDGVTELDSKIRVRESLYSR